ncbi:MAG: 6-phosphogluconolactonase [Thermoplasmata archaeon]|nr:6-phosphogluconolactonase [Thermoplasmata archaeon]MCI4344097.1 6-phosphogluconolactonase [Thermoplasmata archaeon]
MVASVRTRIEVVRDAEALGPRVGLSLAEAARRSVARGGRFRVVLPGGSSPLPLFRWLAGPGVGEIPWSETELFWGDERCVPPEDPRSNFGSAFRTFVARVPIPGDHVHRWMGELAAPASAADELEETLRGLSAGSFPPAAPLFDVAILGIGPDGHTASLFPGRPSLDVTNRWTLVEPTPAWEPTVPRLSMTLPALSASREVYLIAAGAAKREIVRRVLLPSPEPPLPAARVQAHEERRVFLDTAAAEGLPGVDRSATSEPGVA